MDQRATNRERFAVLHSHVRRLLDALECEYDVERIEPYRSDVELERGLVLVRPTVRLAPLHTSASPIVVAFSGFPGLRVRCGRSCTLSFPECGCDACNETAEGEVARLDSLVDDVVSGRFTERMLIGADDYVWAEWQLWSDLGRMEAKVQLEQAEDPRFVSLTPSSHAWKPWSRRNKLRARGAPSSQPSLD